MINLDINTSKLESLAKQKNWSIPHLAKKIGIDYSYLFRILNNEKKGGAKFFTGLYSLCKQEGLNIDEYIFLSEPLSADNERGKIASNQ